MPLKLSKDNKIEIPGFILREANSPRYFDVSVENGKVVLSPTSPSPGDLIREEMEARGIDEQDIADAIQWSRNS